MTTQIAIFDTGPGFLQWIGRAQDHASAVKALHKDVGLWELAVDREEVLERAAEPGMQTEGNHHEKRTYHPHP